MSSQQESNLHLEFRKFLFYPLNYGTNMLYHYLLHTFTTHFPFSPNTNFTKIKSVLHFLKTDYPKLNNLLGNIRSHYIGLPPKSKLPICYTLLLHTFGSFQTIKSSNTIQFYISVKLLFQNR